NAVLHEDGRIVNVLRGRQAGDRAIFPGEPYESPPPANRYGRDDGIEKSEARATWHDRLAGFPPEQRAVELISRFAYTGSLNAGWILGAAGQRSATSEGSADELPAAFDRWWWLRGRPPAAPWVLRLERGSQPYPLPLTGLAHGSTSSLLEAMERVSSDLTPIRHPDPDLEAARAVIQRGRTATRRKLERLREELSEAGGAARIRETGDLLLARLGEVPRGADRVSLEDWTGEVVEIPLDPSLSPAENASKFYDEARRKARAGEQLPSLIRAAEDELRRWDDAAAALDR